MTKRRRTHDEHQRPHHQPDDDFIPLPIQTFLWRQTSPFVRPLIGKAKELAMIEQREACKLFERIIITNNVWGQSMSLTDAIASIDRWRLIKVSFPFVLQCTAALLNNKLIKDHNFNRLGGNEAKMMYTLQWILMNASEECADSENEAKSNATNVAIAAATGASLLKPSDASATTSATGAASTSAVSPNTSAAARGQHVTSQTSNSSVSTALQDQAQVSMMATGGHHPMVSTSSSIAAGGGGGGGNLHRNQSGRVGSTSSCGPHQSIVIPAAAALMAIAQPATISSLQMQTTLPSSSSSVSPIGSSTPTKPLTPTNPPSCPSNYLLPISSIQMFVYYFAPIIDGLKHSDFLSTNQRLEIGASLWEPLFFHQLPDINCLKAQIKAQRSPESTTVVDTPFFPLDQAEKSQQSQSAAAVRQAQHLVSIMSIRDRRRSSSVVNDPAHFGDVFLGGPSPSTAPSIFGPSAAAASKTPGTIPEVPSSRSSEQGQTFSNLEQSALITKSLYATYLDVAVLRCLFITDWQESGIFWGLNYLSNRLVEHLYKDDASGQTKERRRSKSLSCIDSSDIRRNVTTKRDQFKKAYGKRDHKSQTGKHEIRVSQDESSTSSQPDRMSAGSGSIDKTTTSKSRVQQGSAQPSGSVGGHFLRVEDAADGSDSGDGTKEPKSPIRRLSFSSGMQTLANQIRKTSKRVKKPSDGREQFEDGITSESQLSINQSGFKYGLRGPRRSSSADDLSSSQLSALSLLQKDTFHKLHEQHDHRRSDNKSMTESTPVITVTTNIQQHPHLQMMDATGDVGKQAKLFTTGDELDQDLDSESMAKAERQYLMESLYTKSLRHLERLTRSQTIPKDMHFSQFENHNVMVEKSESVGANHYVDELGRIDPLVVLKVLHSISQRDGACSQRVCDKLLQLMTKLINIGILKKDRAHTKSSSSLRRDLMSLLPTSRHPPLNTLDKKRFSITTEADQNQQMDDIKKRNVLVHKMLIDIVFRLHHHLGCPNHCGMQSTVDRHHQGHQQMLASLGSGADAKRHHISSVSNDAAFGRNLRLKLRDALEILCNYDKQNFIKYIQDVFSERPLQLVIDILHSTLGFCRPDYLAYLKQNSPQKQQAQTSTKQVSTHTQSVQFAPEPGAPQPPTRQPATVGLLATSSRGEPSIAPTSPAEARVRASVPNTSFHTQPIQMTNQQQQQPQPQQQPPPGQLQHQHSKAAGDPEEPVENIIVSHSFKELITRIAIVSKELKFQENTSLYSDIRKLISFIRENYCGTFRSIVLSALIDCTKLLNQQQKLMMACELGPDGVEMVPKKMGGDNTRPPSEDESTTTGPTDPIPSRGRDAGRPEAGAEFGEGPTATRMGMDACNLSSSTTTSMHQRASSNLDGDALSGSGGQHRTSLGSYRFYPSGQSKAQRQMSPVQGLSGQAGHDQQQQSQSGGILSLSKAKKKLEQAFGGKQTGKAGAKLGSSQLGESDLAMSGSIGPGFDGEQRNVGSLSGVGEETSRRASLVGHQSLGSFHNTPHKMSQQHYVKGIIPPPLGPASIMIIKQNHLIYSAVQTGMASFSFLMESCLPGDLLDPALLAALLDLKSPIAIRAAIFLECANFVHKCNRGQWPSWMRMNMGHRNSTVGGGGGGGLHSSGSRLRKSSCVQKTARNNTIMYRAAGRAFYAWAEAVGTRLEELILQEQEAASASKPVDPIIEDTENSQDNNQAPTSESMENQRQKQTQFVHSPSDIDFLQSTLNGDSSPFALKMAACQLLFEVTTFLRETFRYLPPTIVQHHQVGGVGKGSDKMSSIYDVSRAVTANRRWSMALSSLGFGQLPGSLNALSSSVASSSGTSGGALKSLAGGGGGGATSVSTAAPIPEHPERRISFILHETNDEDEQQQQQKAKGQEGASLSSGHNEPPGHQSQLVSPMGSTTNTASVEQPQKSGVASSAVRHLSQSSASSAIGVVAATLLRSSGVIDNQFHRRKSIKLRRGGQEKEKQDKKTKFAQDFDEEAENSSISDAGIRRTDSMRSRRRVSGISEKSDTTSDRNLNGLGQLQATDGSQQVGGGGGGGGIAAGDGLSGNESPVGNGSCEDGFATGDAIERNEADESRIMSDMPWFKAIALVNSRIDCNCSHFPTCRPQCYKLHQNTCKRLISFVQNIYQDPTEHDYVSSIFEKRLTNLMNMSNPQQKHQDSTNQKGRNVFRSGTSDGSKNILGGTGGSGGGGHSDSETTSNKRKDKRAKKHHHHYHNQQIDSPQEDYHQSPKVSSLSSSKKHDKSNRVQSMMMPVDPSATGNGLSTMVTDTIKALTAAKVKERGLEEPQIVKYLRSNVKSLLHCPMAAFLKGAIILPREQFVDMLEFSWNLLLEDDQQLSRTAAVCFIISSIKCPTEASKLLIEELESQDASRKMAAINKFYVVWDSRYQCWPRLEDGAFVHFKMAPPSIEFTLPSPKIAQESSAVVDPPWIPRKTSNVEEVTIGQDQTVQKSFVTATKTRRKQQIELVSKALREKHDKLREDREKYHITSVPITLYAAYEPSLGQQVGGTGGGDEMDGTGGGGAGQDEDAQQENRALLQMKTAQVLFPTCLCQAAIVMINLLDDSRVTYEGSAVYEIASKAIWSCLVEDPALFLRYFFERLTRQNQSTIFQVLRRLIRFMPRLPPQAAYTLYNYLIGFIIYYIRCPVESSQKLIADTLSVLCLVVPSVHGLFLKDLKQILRKEQCDHNLLITANVPSAKKIIVHGSDSSGIPSQFPIDEATQFYHILLDSLEFFGIEKDKQNEYFLIDVRTNLMHNLHSYVRDHYSFKRSQHPQLQLINMNPGKAFDILQKQEFINQFLEFGKVSMSLSIVKSSHMAVQRALFLHEELMKLPTFPRKALETNFSLFKGPLGHQVFSMDRVHKICWVRVIARMFELTSGFFLQLGDIQLFLNAISGVFVLHCEEASVSRLCLATFINATHQFKSIFASDGFIPIMSTIIQVYSNHQNNQLLCRSIEFVCKQFYIMHRKPFLLQLFGSVASRLNTAEILQQNQTNFPIGLNQPSGSSASNSYHLSDPSRISPTALFRLLQSLEKAFKDPLDILELVDAEKPLRAVDFCYQHDKEVIEILDLISLCVTVTAYASESPRSTQMLIILESIVPLYMKHLQASTSKKAGQSMGKQAHKDELQKIHSISICIRTLIVNCEGLTRNFNGPLPSFDFRSSSIRRTGPKGGDPNKAGATNSAGSPMDICQDEHSFTGPPERPSKRETREKTTGGGLSGGGTAGGGGKQTTFVKNAKNYSSDESELTRGEFIVPRDTLLNLVAEFLSLSTGRLVESAKKYVELHQKHSSYELLDVKSHLRLAEVANSLLKFASTDPSVMACRGLIRYMNEILPNTEWRQEAIRPALIMILKRLDKTFNRIAKKNWVKKSTDWEAAKQLLKGAYLTFIKHPYIVHLPHLKSLISCCQNIILSDGLQSTPSIAANLFHGFTSSSSAAAAGQAPAQSAQSTTGAIAPNTQQSSEQRLPSASGGEGGGGGGSHFLNVASSFRQPGGSGGGGAGSSLSPWGSGGLHNASSAPTTSQVSGPAWGIGGGGAASVGPGNQSMPSLAAVTAAAALAERLASNNANSSVTSQGFNSVTIRLIAMQLLQTGENQTLESFIGNSMNTPEKLESVMLNFIYPMCIRVCSGARDAPKLRSFDVMYILNIVLNMLAPQSASSKSCSSSATSPKAATDTSQFILSKITTTIGSTQTGATALGIVGSSAHSAANTHQIVQHQESLKIGFLGLKILCVCFEAQLASEWVRLTRVIRDLALQAGQPSGPLWDFLDFVATYRFPLFILLLPTIKYDLARKISSSSGGGGGGGNNNNVGSDNDTVHYAQCLRMIEAKIRGTTPTVCRSKSFLFVSLTAELRMLKEQLIARRRQLLEGERQASSNPTQHHHHHHHHHHGLQPTAGSSSPNQSGAGPAGDGSQQGAGGGAGGGGAGTGDHFTAYHRLSAAIASFANQGAQGKLTPSASGSGSQMGTSAALKGACFAAQLATSAPIGAQLSDATSGKSMGDQRNESSQSSIRLSTAKSREEARKVMNTILRRTSYPHNQSLVPPEQGTGERKNSQPPSPNRQQQQSQVDVESGRGNQIIMDPAMLMAVAFPPPKRSNVEGSGILKQLVQTIDRQNQKQRQQQQQSTGHRPSQQYEPEQASTSSSSITRPVVTQEGTPGEQQPTRAQSMRQAPTSHTHEQKRD